MNWDLFPLPEQASLGSYCYTPTAGHTFIARAVKFRDPKGRSLAAAHMQRE